jgi:phosphopantetheinyl transferase
MADAAQRQHSSSEDAALVADFVASVSVLPKTPSETEIRGPSAIHLWLIDQEADEFLATAERIAPSPEDEARAACMKNEKAVRLFLAQRAALRLVLGRHLGRSAEEVRLIRLPGGKPALAPLPGDSPLGFSLSHSGGCFALAVGVASLGVDIEAPRPVTHANAIAARWFLPEEHEALASGAGEDGFLALWTAKEALAKRHGAGLRLLRPGVEDLAIAPEWCAGRLKPFRTPLGAIGTLAAGEPIAHISVSEDLPAG